MSETRDIVIVGAGIIGLCTAFQLSKRTNARILVLEKGAGLGEGSTGASSAVCRFKYSRPEMVQLAIDGVSAYRNWADFLGLATPRAVFHQDGVLWFAIGDRAQAEAESRRLQGLGVVIAVLDDVDLQRQFPAISPCGIAPDLETGMEHDCTPGRHSHLLELEAGYIDPSDALQDVLDSVRAKGVEVRFNAGVESVRHVGNRIQGAILRDGSSIDCGTVVNAAGPWCNDLNRSAQIDLKWPLKPTRIQVVHIDRPPEVVGPIPVTCDIPGGIYFRTQNRGQQLIVSSILEEDEKEIVEDPDHFARYVDDDYVRAKLHALHHRLPALTYRGVQGYSGLYTINSVDVHPIVGRTPLSGYFLANGCSGHGFKIAPAVGSLLAQAITNIRVAGDTEVDPAFLAVDREPISVGSLSVLA
jgi:sarcosine oxidase, subunit beta